MKLFHKLPFLSLLLGVTLSLFSSCEDYLSVVPKGQKIPVTLNDFALMLKDEYAAQRVDALQALILHYRNEIVWTFARLTDGRDAMLRFYQFNDIPVYYSMSDFVLVSGMTIIICLLAGILPAMRTLRMKPSDALRSE